MTFLTPLLAGVAAAIGVPLLVFLYFLKLRRRDVEISTTLLWKKAIQDMQANAPFQRLRRNILLILQLLALGAALFGVAQPMIKRQSIEGVKHVIMIDRSASMSGEDEPDGRGGKISRLDAARKQALALVESLRDPGVFEGRGETDEAMVITFDAAAEVRLALTADKTALRSAISGITATDAPTSIKEAMALARAHAPKRFVENQEKLSGGTPLTIHVWSDGKIADVDKAVAEPEDTVIFHKVGTPEGGNVGITVLRAERAYDDPTNLTVFVGLQNNEAAPRTVDVELLVDGTPSGLRSVTVPAASSEARGSAQESNTGPPTPGVGGTLFLLARPEGALVQVNIRQPGSAAPPEGDVLATDNRAWLVIPPARRLAVAFVTPGNLFLRSLLSGLPLSKFTEIPPDAFEALLRNGKSAEYDVVVLDGTIPTTAAGATGLPAGRYLIFGAVPTGPKSGLTDKGKGPQAGIVDWSREHPSLRGAALDELVIAESRLVEVAAGSASTAIALSDKGPAIIELSAADTHALIVPFDVAQSTWPFKLSFVVFTASGINYLAEDVTQASARMVQPGATLSDRLPGKVDGARVEAPGGATSDITQHPDETFTYGPVLHTGVYRVSWTGAAGPTDLTIGSRAARFYAANLLDPAESDTRTTSEIPLASRVVGAATRASSQGDRKLWPWLVLGALAVMMLEWFIYNRKVQV